MTIGTDQISNVKRTAWLMNQSISTPGSLSTSVTEPSLYNGSTSAQFVTEVSEYNNMLTNISENGGFYVARFEAGDGSVTVKRNIATEMHTVVSKKNAIVYNWVKWGTSMTEIKSADDITPGAVYLSQNMYITSEYGVKSTLIYGIQWDTIMRWLAMNDYNVSNSKDWGNYSDSTGDALVNSGATSINSTTGRNEAWKANNIYDLAGNYWEWTMEAYLDSQRSQRGGLYRASGATYAAGVRGQYTPQTANNDYTFRVVLKID